jgi:hypothetical protein
MRARPGSLTRITRRRHRTTLKAFACDVSAGRLIDVSVGPQSSGNAFDREAGCARCEIITADPLGATPGHHESGVWISVLTAGASRLSRRSWERLLGHNADQRHCGHRQRRLRVEINQGVLLLGNDPAVADMICRAGQNLQDEHDASRNERWPVSLGTLFYDMSPAGAGCALSSPQR